jgi:nitrate reductase NapE component
MSVPDGWQPLSKPRRRAGADAFHLSPFARLARSHVLTALGDALVTIALAGSLFFELDPNDARWKVFLYLALTMAPLAIVAPFIGPALDRSHGGRRWMIVAVNGVRALICLVMLDDLDSLLLFPQAFTVLAMGKAYGVARSALVPTVVRNDAELVEANSKLQLLSGLAAPGAGVLAAPAYAIADSQGVLAVAVVAYVCATVAALRIPTTQVAATPVTEEEAAELRGMGVLLAASAMGLVRGIVGFLTFLLLFELRDDPTWHLGVVLGLTGAGALVGSTVAPTLRRRMAEERMIITALTLTVVVALAVAWVGGLVAAAFLAATVAIVSTCAKLAFDSIVQRDAPDANRGRSFARFEVRFQLVWVVGAMLPLLLLPIPVRAGFVAIAATAAFALFSYLAGQRSAHRAHAGGAGDAEGPGAPSPDDGAPIVAAAQPSLYDDEAQGDPEPTVVDATANDATVAERPAEPDIGFADDDLLDSGFDPTTLQPLDRGDDATWQLEDPVWAEGDDDARR